MALAGLGRLVSTRRGLIALAMALATIYTLTLYDAAALTGPARAAPASPSTGTVAGKLREKWSWGTGGGIMGDLGAGGDAPAPVPQALEVEALPRQNYRAEDDPILAVPGAVDPNVQPAKLTNHHARPFGKTAEDAALRPADRAAVEQAKGKAGTYSPHELARLKADLAEAQAPAPKKKAAAAQGGIKKQATDDKKGGKEQQTTTATDPATVASASALETGSGAGVVDETAGSATSTPGEDGLEDAPSVAAEKGAADAAPMAALVLPAAKGKDAAVMPKDVQQAIATQADAAAAGTEPASHAAAKAASPDATDTKQKQAMPPPPSEKIRQQHEPLKEGKVLLSEPDVSAETEARPVGKKPKIGTGRRVVKPLPGSDTVQKAAAAMPQRVGGGEKAGRVVKQEAGKRVGTGARPGAKGMGMRRMRLAKRT
ncbi:hypothetical protein JCM3774_000775 [Rhodotorula dairenensis]